MSGAQDAPVHAEVHLLPAEALFAPPIADTRSGLSRLILRRVEESLRIDAGIAADLPFIEWGWKELHLQTGLDAAVFMDFDAGGAATFDLQTFDGLFSIPVEVAGGRWSGRLALTHLSAHYGDGVRKDGEVPTNRDAFSREYVQGQGASVIGPVRAYIGGVAIFHSAAPTPPWGIQAGAEATGPWTLAPYGALDLQARAENGWEPAFAAQAGVRAHVSRRRLRLGLVVHTGPDDTGKYAENPERYIGGVIGFDSTGALAPGPAGR